MTNLQCSRGNAIIKCNDAIKYLQETNQVIVFYKIGETKLIIFEIYSWDIKVIWDKELEKVFYNYFISSLFPDYNLSSLGLPEHNSFKFLSRCYVFKWNVRTVEVTLWKWMKLRELTFIQFAFQVIRIVNKISRKFSKNS